MSDLKTRLKAFLMNSTDEKEFVITQNNVAELSREDVQIINEMIERERKLEGSSGFKVEPATNPGDTLKIVKDPKMVASAGDKLYKDAQTDARLSAGPVADDGNPFRPRYRKLGSRELDHHDKIKLQAMDLLTTFRQIPTIRSQDGSVNDGEGMAQIKLAQRALEIAVYHAVKALTA